jgi:hypothetical protein
MLEPWDSLVPIPALHPLVSVCDDPLLLFHPLEFDTELLFALEVPVLCPPPSLCPEPACHPDWVPAPPPMPKILPLTCPLVPPDWPEDVVSVHVFELPSEVVFVCPAVFDVLPDLPTDELVPSLWLPLTP